VPSIATLLIRAQKIALLSVLAFLLQTVSAWSHASLNATVPADGSVMEAWPESFTLTFSEPVAPLAFKLVMPDGSSQALDRVKADGNVVSIEAPGNGARGTHVLSWRVVSEDGHPIGGSIVFSIGEAGVRPPSTAAEVNWTVRGGLWLGKVALYIGLFIGVGGAVARTLLMPGTDAARGIVLTALAIGSVGAISSAGFQGLDALGVEVEQIVDPAIWSAGLSTTYGRTVGFSLVALLLGSITFVSSMRTSRIASLLALAGVGAALAASGHASAADPQWLMRPAVFLHAVAVVLWTGALMPLGALLARGDADALPALSRFSRIIPWIILVLILSGSTLAIVQVGRAGALLDTAYGQVFTIKLALLVGLFVLAGINRWTLTGRSLQSDTAASRRLARSIVTETVLALLIFGAVAAWRFTPPPRVLDAAAAIPASTHIHDEKAMATVWVTPGRAGAVTISASLQAPDASRLQAKEVSLVFGNQAAGIEPFKRALATDGTKWSTEATIPLAGLWQVRLDILISDFELVRLEGELDIRP